MSVGPLIIFLDRNQLLVSRIREKSVGIPAFARYLIDRLLTLLLYLKQRALPQTADAPAGGSACKIKQRGFIKETNKHLYGKW